MAEFNREDVEEVAACLGDDAAQIRREQEDMEVGRVVVVCEEWADNMDRAASMLTWMLLTHPAFADGVGEVPPGKLVNGQWEGVPLSRFPELQEQVRKGLADGTLQVEGNAGVAVVPPIPEGYVLVPVKPTPAMVEVMLDWGTKRSEWEMILRAANPTDGVNACLSRDGQPNHCVLWKCHESKACARGVAMREVPVTLEQVEAIAKTMWKGEPVPGRVLRFGAAVLGLADAAAWNRRAPDGVQGTLKEQP